MFATTLVPTTGTVPVKPTIRWACDCRPKTLTVVTSFNSAEMAVVTTVTVNAPYNVSINECRMFFANSESHNPAENFA